jgi:putative flippase GtrA
MSNWKTLVEKIFRFCITGGLGMVIDFGFTIFCKEHLKLNPYFSNILGTMIALIVIFFMHKNWTFGQLSKKNNSQFGQFILISFLGLGLNSCIIYVLRNEMLFDFYYSKVIAIGVVSIWNFTLNYFFTFSDRRELLN